MCGIEPNVQSAAHMLAGNTTRRAVSSDARAKVRPLGSKGVAFRFWGATATLGGSNARHMSRSPVRAFGTSPQVLWEDG